MMRWYFAIDEVGGSGHTGEEAKLAVSTAQAVGGLEPRLLYYGRRSSFTRWMTKRGVEIIDVKSDFIEKLHHLSGAGLLETHSIGHWLRCALPEVEHQNEYVLYTDCDVVFLDSVSWGDYRPSIFCAAPEFRLGNWRYFNSGVMIINVPAMQGSYEAFKRYLAGKVAQPNGAVDDQQEMNKYYRRLWDYMDPRLNWKPYWGFKPDARILHFHGPKVGLIEAIAAGKWLPKDAGGRNMNNLLIGHVDSYLEWARFLGNMKQVPDTRLTSRLRSAAIGLAALRDTFRAQKVDLSFMEYRMFDDD